MWVVGAATTTRWTRPAASISCATRSPKVVLPAAGVADARKLGPSWARSASSAAACQARSGRSFGHGGSARVRPGATAVVKSGSPFGCGQRLAGGANLGGGPEGSDVCVFAPAQGGNRALGVLGRRLSVVALAAVASAAIAVAPAPAH